MATNDEIERLKHSWIGDPCWDIEETEGFEEHKEELLVFRKEYEGEAEQKRRESAQRRAKKLEDELGIEDPTGMQSLYTFTEIERDISRNAIGEASPFEMSMVELAQAQTRATLLLAAQVKRVADMYGRYLSDLDADAEREEIRNLYQ